MPHHAHGAFTVAMQPLASPPAEGLSRFSIDKQIHGDLEATSKGEMLSGGDPHQGAAGFALQHSATMDSSGHNMTVIVVPGSGTGDLKGIAGVFTIKIENGQHLYDLDYTLPE